VIEVARGGPPRGALVGGRLSKPRDEVGQEGGQQGIGVVQAGDGAEAQFADEAILQGAPEAFDAALGLGGLGGFIAAQSPRLAQIASLPVASASSDSAHHSEMNMISSIFGPFNLLLTCVGGGAIALALAEC